MIDPNRRAELIAAAVDDSLTDRERVEFDAARAVDPTIDREVVELRAVVARMVAGTATWDASTPDASLRDRVIGVAGAESSRAESSAAASSVTASSPASSSPPMSVRNGRRAGRGWLVGIAAAACVLIGIGGTLGVQAIGSQEADGPPGTLGAVELVEFTGEPDDVVVDGSLVAHTWGTETILEIDGLVADDSYSVIVIARDGSRVDSGSFLGSTVTIDCRMNASVPREDVAGVEIQDDAGAVVAAASVPVVS